MQTVERIVYIRFIVEPRVTFLNDARIDDGGTVAMHVPVYLCDDS